MNKLIITAVAIYVGLWTQYAGAAIGDGADIGDQMTQEQLTANHCTAGHVVGGCVDPLYLDYGVECQKYMSTISCTACQKGYVLTPYTCIPNNETGFYMDNCMLSMMTQEELASSYFAYICQCSSLFHETGKAGYLFSGCYSGSITFKCDASNKYYQTSTSTSPTCNVSTDSDGNFTFSRCIGCSKCNEETTYWKAANTGYQRAYKKRFINGTTPTCEEYALNEWRCAANYYGTSTNGTSGCNPCPTFESVGLTPVCNSDACPYISAPAGSTQISQCFATTFEPSLDVYLRDSTGKFHWIPEDDTIDSYGKCNYQ